MQLCLETSHRAASSVSRTRVSAANWCRQFPSPSLPTRSETAQFGRDALTRFGYPEMDRCFRAHHQYFFAACVNSSNIPMMTSLSRLLKYVYDFGNSTLRLPLTARLPGGGGRPH